MGRPKKNRIVSLKPVISYFIPSDIPAPDSEMIKLSIDERESLNLSDLMDMSYEQAGQTMGISRATFGRIIRRARKIVADALINGKIIHTVAAEKTTFICDKCSHQWNDSSSECPACKHEYFHRIS